MFAPLGSRTIPPRSGGKQTTERHGPEQVHAWRRGYATPPPPVGLDSPEHPINDPRYAHLPPDVLPASEHLEDVSDDDISDINIPTGAPRSYSFDDRLAVTEAVYLGDADAVAAAAAAVAAQAGTT